MSELNEELQAINAQRLQLHDLLTTIFDVASAPLHLDRLTQLIAEFWGIEDRPPELLDADTYAALDDQKSHPATIIERRQSLQLLWREIRQLPRRQRVALLLNPRRALCGSRSPRRGGARIANARP